MVFPLDRQAPSGPLIPPGPDGACPPLSRTLYVDGQTLVDPADQDGSICAPFDSIQDALDAIPTPPDLSDAADLLSPFEVLVAPGVYAEALVVPTTGYSITIKGHGASGPSVPLTFFPFSAPSAPGPTVNITTFGGGGASITIAPSGPPWDDPSATVLPSYQFESLLVDEVFVDADGVDPSNIGLMQIIFRRSLVLDLTDIGSIEKWAGIFTVLDSAIVLADTPGAGYLGERSLFVTVDAADMQLADCIAEDLDINDSGAIFGSDGPGLSDTFVSVSLDDSGSFDPIQMDATTASYAEQASAISTSQPRRVQDNNARAFATNTELDETLSATTYVFDEGTNCAVLGAIAGGRAATLPDGAQRSRTATSGTRVLGEMVIVKSSPSSIGTLTVNPSGGETIDGGPVALAPNESAIFIAVTSTRWIVAAKS